MNDGGKWDVISPKAGDMLRVNAGAYYHYGVYIGGDEVVEFGSAQDAAGTDAKDVRVQRSSIDDFLACGGFLEVRVLNRAEKRAKRSDKQIVAHALSKIGDGGYNLIENNCLHFANECVFADKNGVVK